MVKNYYLPETLEECKKYTFNEKRISTYANDDLEISSSESDEEASDEN